MLESDGSVSTYRPRTPGSVMRRGVPLIAFALLSLAGCVPLSAQQPAVARPGHRVRIVTLGGDRIIGILRAVVGDTLVLDVREGALRRDLQLSVPASQVRALHVSRGGRSRFATAFVGAVVGIGSGFAIGYLAGADASCSGCNNPRVFAGMGFGIVGGVLGTVAGIAVGGERWARAASPP